jgi:type IV conjugative transfer system coupling protein TraD
MVKSSSDAFSSFVRGGQVLGHAMVMAGQEAKRYCFLVFCWGVVCIVIVNLRAPDDMQTFGALALMADLLHWMGPPFPQHLNVPTPGLRPLSYPVTLVPHLSWVEPLAYGYRRLMILGGVLWLIGDGLILTLMAFWYTQMGREKIETTQMRGQLIVSAKALIAQIDLFNRQEAKTKGRPEHLPAKLVGVPYPFDGEFEHTLITGSPGSGKSVAIHKLIASIRERGDRAVIYDPELEYTAQHFDPDTDMILNPFDERSVSWSPFYDATDHVEWDRLAHGLFKEPKGGDPYWSNVARSVFTWTCFMLKQRDRAVSLETALNHLFGPTDRLLTLLEGTPAHEHLERSGGPRVASIKSVLVEGVTPLIYLLGDGEAISIRGWVNQERRSPGILFLSAPETHAETLRPLLGFWSEIVVNALLSRKAEGVGLHPTWVVLDEFPSLGRIDELAKGPNRVRKYGGAMVLGMQQISQVQEIYGKDMARTIMGQCLNKLVLRCGDSETAQTMSEILGERVMNRPTENTSYGANSLRDGVSISQREDKEAVYLPTDLMNLPSLQGVIRVTNKRKSGPFPIAPIRFEPDNLPAMAPGFVPRSGPDPVTAFILRAKREAQMAASRPRPSRARSKPSVETQDDVPSEGDGGGISADPAHDDATLEAQRDQDAQGDREDARALWGDPPTSPQDAWKDI